MALSLGSPPPDVIRHRLSVEPGLSSPATFRHLRGAAVRPTDTLGMVKPGSAVKAGLAPVRSAAGAASKAQLVGGKASGTG